MISSHEDLRTSKGSGKGWYYKKILVNGQPNKTIIREIYTLDKISRDSLSTILTTPNNDSIIQDIKCFEPHHSILIYTKGKCAYFDICFSCRHFITSKDIKVENDELSDKSWETLKLFFQNRNLNFEMTKNNEQ